METFLYKSLVRKYFLWTTSIFLMVAAIFISIFYIQDPLQFFHRSRVADSPLSADMRAQAAGILNTFDIDSIILGTSIMENTSASEASAKLGGKFFNISIPGGDYSERAVLLRRALGKGMKNVLYSLDYYYINGEHRDHRISKYLYDDNPVNDLGYYATMGNIKKLFSDNKGLTQRDHDRPNAWFHLPSESSRFGGIAHWVTNRGDTQVKGFLLRELPDAARAFPYAVRQEMHDRAKEQRAKHYIEKNILEPIRDHEDTNFYFIFPPYSRFYYAKMRRNEAQDFFLHQAVVRYMVDRTKDNKNIHIYGFEDQDFLDDIANYKDPTHYHQRFNSMFLDAIATGRHELTPENVEDYLKRCEQKAWDYDIPALNDEVQGLLKAAEARDKG